jgi:AraC-like DNA-binding protein
MTIPQSATPLRFSTDMFAPSERVTAWREFVGHGLLKLDIEPSNGEFHAEATFRSLPGLGVVTGKTTASRNQRSRHLLDSDDFLFSIVRAGQSRFAACGREAISSVGDAVLVGGGEGGVKDARTECEFVSLRVPRRAIGSIVAGLNDLICRRIPAGTPALRLLARYLDVLDDTAILATPCLQQHVATHVHDLIALALGASGEAAEVARNRGGQAARLRAIKDDVAQNLEQGDISLGAIAARHRVSPRYLQKLFDSDGTTFSEYVLGQRLAHAHHALSDPRRAAEKIASIAFAAGFGDISYFYRAFRRRYDVLPTDVRAAARRPN